MQTRPFLSRPRRLKFCSRQDRGETLPNFPETETFKIRSRGWDFIPGSYPYDPRSGNEVAHFGDEEGVQVLHNEQNELPPQLQYSPSAVRLNMRTPAGGNMIGANTLATVAASGGKNRSNCTTYTATQKTNYKYKNYNCHLRWPTGADWAAWHLPGGPVGPPARWAATSNVELGSGTKGGGREPVARKW